MAENILEYDKKLLKRENLFLRLRDICFILGGLCSIGFVSLFFSAKDYPGEVYTSGFNSVFFFAMVGYVAQQKVKHIKSIKFYRNKLNL